MKTRNILKRALVFLVLAALLAPVFLVKGAAAAETKTYDVKGFSVTVPAAWEHTQTEMQMKDLQIKNLPKEAQNGEFSLHMFMDGQEKGMIAVSMDMREKINYKKMKKRIDKELKKGDISSMMAGMSVSTDIKTKTIKTDLGKGMKMTMTITQNNKKQGVDVYLLCKGTKIFMMAGVGVDCSSVIQSVK